MLVSIKYFKRVSVGLIVSSTIVTEHYKLSGLGIVGDKIVAGFGHSSTGGIVHGRAFPMVDIIELIIL